MSSFKISKLNLVSLRLCFFYSLLLAICCWQSSAIAAETTEESHAGDGQGHEANAGQGHDAHAGQGHDAHAGQEEHAGGHEDGSASSSYIPKHILAHKWSYHHRKTGPANWERLFKACGGQFQSPIDIDTQAAVYWGNAQFEFIGYDQLPDSMYIQNNGHTAMLVPEKTIPPRIKGGDLPGEFELVQVHFHWGSRSTRGSEHFIDRKAYPLEMHLVHYNARYPGIKEALETHDHDALAVLGFLFEVSDEDNGRLDSLVARVSQMSNSNGTVGFPRTSLFPMSDLLDVDRTKEGIDKRFTKKFSEFYRYEGSLTTPTCNEQVEWTVFPETIPISERQLEAFRQLRDHLGYTINDNFRPVFPLGGRLLRKYAPKEAAADAESDDDSSHHSLNTIDADFVKHDHEHDHDIYFDPSHYARPEIKQILDEEERPAPAPKRTDSASALREKLEECQELRRALMESLNSATSSCGNLVTIVALFFVVFVNLRVN